MSISTLRKIYIVILVAVVVLMVIGIVQDPSDHKLLVKGAGLLIACIVAIVKLESRYSAAAERTYELQYQNLIGNAFAENKSAKKQLIKGLILFNEKKYDAAVVQLDSLRKDCVVPADYAAILTVRALCFSKREAYDEAIATYKELLDHDPQNSRAWSNMGWCYAQAGRTDLAEDAYQNALRADDKNANAHTNYASLLLDMTWDVDDEYFPLNEDNLEKALEHAKAALRINATLQPALSMACQASARMGDVEGAQEYLKQFGRAGGDWKALKEVMDRETAFREELITDFRNELKEALENNT